MKKTRILSLILAALMTVTSVPLAIPVFAEADVSTPGENAYLDVNLTKGAANTDVINKCLRVTDREGFWVGAKVTTNYQIDPAKTYEIKVDVKAEEPEAGIRPLAIDNKSKVAVENLGTGSGVKFNSGVSTGVDGWYTHTFPYQATAAHAFSLHLCGGVNSSIGMINSTADFYIDNFVLFEDGVPVVEYDFNDESQFTNWAYTQGYDPSVKGSIGVYLRTERPADPAAVTDSYMAITNRENFWAGAIFDPDLSVAAGESYTVKFDVKGENPTTGLRAYPENTNPKNQKLTYNGYSPATGYIAVSFDSGTAVAGRDGWYTHEIKYESLTNHNFVLRLPGWPKTPPTGTNDCDFYIDNLYLYKDGVAEPILYYSFTPGTDYSAFCAWTENDGKAYCADSIITPPAPIIPEEDCGAGVTINTGILAQAGKTYELELALKSNLEGATYFANVYTGTNSEVAQGAVAITAGTADPDAEGWYIHTVRFTAANDGVVNFEILGGEDFAFINNLAEGKSIYVDSIALYEDGVSDALYTANFSTYEDVAEFAQYNETNDQIKVNISFDPGKFIEIEKGVHGAAGILGLLLLKRRAAYEAGEDVEIPEPPKPEPNGYLSVTERPTFWSGVQLETFTDVYAGKYYTIKLEIKLADPTDDFRLGTVESKVTTDTNIGAGNGTLLTSGTPVDGKDGWYSFSFPYIPAADHTFALRIFGGWLAKGTVLPNVAMSDMYIDNFALYEDGVAEPLMFYDFETDEFFEDWSPLVLYTPDVLDPIVSLILPE